MAPKRGEWSSGGSGGGIAGLSFPWTEQFQYSGSRFSDPVARGSIIILGICVFALIIIVMKNTLG